MGESESSQKLFGNLALGILVAGLLVPFVIGAFADEELAVGSGVVADIESNAPGNEPAPALSLVTSAGQHSGRDPGRTERGPRNPVKDEGNGTIHYKNSSDSLP